MWREQMFVLALGTLLLSGCAGVTAQQELLPGLATEEIRAMAEQGNAEAQFKLGGMYEHGRGVPQDFAEGLKWYRTSADQGFALAQSTLGYLYMYGEGVEEDLEAALMWNQKAAEQGDLYGQHNLAVMYDEGMGIPEDNEAAVKWYRRAAMQAYIPAWVNLGVSYWRGEGVPQDNIQAFAWLELARFSTTTSQDMRLKWTIRREQDELLKNMTKEDIRKGKALAKELSDEIFSQRNKNLK